MENVHYSTCKENVSKYTVRIDKEGMVFNPLTPNDDYSGRTAPLTSKR